MMKTKIYNIAVDERIPDLLEEMMLEMPEKQWENIIRKAVRKTGVKEKEPAVKELLEFLSNNPAVWNLCQSLLRALFKVP